MLKKPLLAGISATIAASVAIPALAQEQADFQIEEIVVTAAKRETTLQEVPVAVSVVSSEQIQRSQILDIKDLQFLVPSLKVTQLQTTGNTNFIIRGFGNGANNAGIEPSVGVFIDGVYRSRTAASMADFPNIERIEVLRGPQSTLFGKNASAGVISVITAKPDLDAYSGSVSLTAGDYSQWILKGDVTGPISDKVAFSLSAGMNQRDGYYTNLVNGEQYGERDRWNVRGQLLFQPSDTVEVRLIADYEEIDEACCGVANLFDGPTGQAVRLIGGNLVGNAPFAYENYYDFDPVNQFENGGLSMQIDWDISDSVMLTSITASRTLDRFENSDVDFTSAPLISDDSGNSLDTTIDTLTQELRLQSTGDNTIDWMVGLYYFDEEVDTSSKIAYGPGFRPYADILSANAACGGSCVSALEAAMVQGGLLPTTGIFFAEGQGNDERSGQDNTATSIFGQVDWHLTDRVTLTAGMNYTKDEKDAFVNMTNTDVFSGIDLLQVSTGIGFALIFQQLTGLPPTPANIQANPVAAATAQALSVVACTPQNAPACNPALAFTALTPLQFLPPFVGFPNSVESGHSEDDSTTWTLRLAFDVTDSLNMYVGAGTGFKASSWNLSRDSRPFASDIAALTSAGLAVNNLVAGTRYAGPEDATVYEVGFKYLGDRTAWNLTIFDQEIDGFQGNIFTGTGFVLANAGKQSTTGVEFDVQWNPVDALQLALSATWLDAVYDSFPGGNGVNGPEDLSGKKVPGVPELAMNANANYNFQVGAANGFIRFEYIYEDEVQIIENVPANVASREISMINASTGLAWDNGFEAMIWARNLNNDEFLLSAFPAVAQAGSYSGYPNEPRTYGITVRKYFD